MSGCKPHLPIDLIFGTNTADLKGSSITYIEWPGHIKLQIMLLKKEQVRNK